MAFSTRREHATQTTKKLLEGKPDPLEQLQIVDFLQRVGVDHLFQDQIGQALHRQYLEYYSSSSRAEVHGTLGLHQASLRFRLLREEGYNVSSTDTFEGYMTKQGKFDEERLGNDVLGLMSLFEASQMSIQGEDILDEAKTFSERLLYASADTLDGSSAQLVRDTLKYPHHVTLARFKSGDFIREHKNNARGWRKEIANLASTEFDIARATYKDEILQISKWWKELGLTKELKLARDKPSEWHMWSLGMLPHPELGKERLELTKPTSLIYIIDDVFDIYGKPEDLCVFTESVNRWDLETAEKLPGYMKKCLKAVYDVTSHISHVIWVTHGRNPQDHLRKAWTDLFNAYLVESKWFASGYLPTTREYMEIGTITCGVHLVLVHMMFLLGQGFDYDDNSDGICTHRIYTSIISSVATILRLGNDLGKAKIIHDLLARLTVDEDQVGHDGSYIKCYMKENEGVSMKDAKEHLVGEIWNSWKCLNELCQKLPRPKPYPTPYTTTTFKQGCLNLGRVVSLMYDYDKDPDHPILEVFMKSLLDQ